MDKKLSPFPVQSAPAVKSTVTQVIDKQEDFDGYAVLPPALSYLQGWRLHIMSFTLSLALFLSFLETTIVSTSVRSIIDELHGFEQASWVLAAYLLAFTSFLIPIAKMSDAYGRGPALFASLLLFTAFSAGAGWSRNMATIYVCRAFQGIGGGGIYTMAFVILPEMVPVTKYTRYSVVVSISFAMGGLLGPIIGGLFSQFTTWRWIFWLNIPLGCLALALTFLALPSGFPHHKTQHHDIRRRQSTARQSDKTLIRGLLQVDWIGVFLIVAASLLFSTSLETGRYQFSWSSVQPPLLLAISICCWIAFFSWQKYHSKHAFSWSVGGPLIPWNLFCNRIALGVFLNTFFLGATFFTIIFNLPLFFQIVYSQSPAEAGYRLLAMTLAAPVGSALAGLSIQRLHVPPFLVLLSGSAIQTVGYSIYAALGVPAPALSSIGAAVAAADLRLQYGMEVMMGFGFGVSISTVMMIRPLVFAEHDAAIAMGVISQARALGGCIGICCAFDILYQQLKHELEGTVETGLIQSLLASSAAMEGLKSQQKQLIIGAYTAGFKKQMMLLAALSGMAAVSTLLMVERRLRRMPKGQGGHGSAVAKPTE